MTEIKASPVKKNEGENAIQTIPANTGNSLAKTDNNYTDINTLAETFFKSNFCPDHIKSVKDAVIAILKGKEMGLAPLSSLESIYIIGGKSALSVHLYTAKLIQNNIIYKFLRDYDKVYQYETKDGLKFDEDEYNENDFQLVTPKTPAENYEKDKYQVIRKVIDYVTEVEFTRYMKINGKDIVNKINFEIRISEIASMGLLELNQWKTKPRAMLRSRVLTQGARIIAPDLFFGYMSTNEMLDEEGKSYNVDDEGKIIDVEHEVINDSESTVNE